METVVEELQVCFSRVERGREEGRRKEDFTLKNYTIVI